MLLLFYVYALIALVWLVVNLVHLLQKDARGALRLLLPPILFLVSLYGASIPFAVILHMHRNDPDAVMPNWASGTFPLIYFLVVAPALGLALYNFSNPRKVKP